ncbi:MAG: radical SAM protein [Bacilli bacterium]|jgi:DNA repair photolyase
MSLKVIYEPRGRAGEYADLACNLYAGCDHGCVYCYAPLATRKSRETFNVPSPRAGILNKILDDAQELQRQRETRSILFCFTCDPYQKIDERYQITREALKILLGHGLNVTILTKGGARSERDFDLLAEHPDQVTYAATLVFTDEERRLRYETGTATPTMERITALKRAHRLGIQTWVSLEPVFDPVQSLDLIRQTHEFVDLYKVGTLNYMLEAKAIDWSAFGRDAIALLESLGKDYYIKDDLKRHLNVGRENVCKPRNLAAGL